MGEIRRLPLWKNCLDTMHREGIEYGKRFTTKFFEEELSQSAPSIRFGIDVSRIRRELEKEGFYLSGQGLKGEYFEIIPAADNHMVMGRYLQEAKDKTKRAVTLGVSTPMDVLSPSEQTRHMQKLERAQIRQALITNEKPIQKLLQKTHPSLIKAIQDKEGEQ